MIFSPSPTQVRTFFCDAWRKHLAAEPMAPIERLAADCVLDHPEHHALLADTARALGEDFSGGGENPFLHLSLHLALREQFSIDQPPGIRSELERLARRGGDWHLASHEAMACLVRAMDAASRVPGGASPDEMGADYLERLRRA
jgi:hypothetical protein